MPVVEKIDSIDGVSDFIICITATTVSARINGMFLNPKNFIEGETRLQRTYQAVVQFIKWYNANK
jgi:hypothetical protein